MDSPYKSPTVSEIDVASVASSKKLFGRIAWLCGLGVVVPPLFGLAGTIKGMVGAFSTLGETGTADPSVLAGDISVALLTTLWGFIFSAVSLIPFIVFLVLYLNKRKMLRFLTANKPLPEKCDNSSP